MVSLPPERLVGLLNEDTNYSIPPLLAPAQTELLRHPTLLPGERILLQQDATCVDTFTSLVRGILHLTTFRIIFSGATIQDLEDNSNNDECDDDATELARKGYIFQTQQNKSFKKKQATIDRFKQKAQNFQDSLQATKSSITLKPSGRSKSKDLDCVTLLNGRQSVISPNDICRLVKVEPLSHKTSIKDKDVISHNIVVSIPCTNIYDVRKLPKSFLTKGTKLALLADGVELLCSTLQTYKFYLPLSSAHDADKLVSTFSKYTKNLSPSKWFAIAYNEAIMVPPKSTELLRSKTSQNFYNFKIEFKRLGLLESSCWNVMCPKKPYIYSSPIMTLVPFSISEAELFDIIKFHGGKSYPSICWRNQLEGTIMLRSGATLYRRGMVESHCEADEDYLASICRQNKQSSECKLVVFTELNRTSTATLRSTSQQISGQISPRQGEAFYYPYVKFVYTYKDLIPDHNVVRENSYRLQTLLSSSSDKSFYSALGETQWLSEISELLETAYLIITALSTDKLSVLISYEEGRDRTAQLSSLAQLLLDPYYRTIDGFQVLIQKEWLSFGHMFEDRCISHKPTETHGPFFVQWLDCVWQVTKQFPLSFEFNEDFLQTIAEHVYSCRFGTFLCNSERQHMQEEIDNRTISLWTWINLTLEAEPGKFTNPYFRNEKTKRVLMPRFHIPSLKVWESYYAKTRIEDNLQEARHFGRDQGHLVEYIYLGVLNKYIGLKSRSNPSQSDGEGSESSLEISSMISGEAKPEIISDVFDVHNSAPPIESKTASLKSSKPVQYTGTMRNLESKSLDNLLDSRRRETQSKTKKRLGSSKFYVNQPKTKEVFENAMAELKEPKSEPQNHVVRRSQMFDYLCDYLESKGLKWESEAPEINITKYTCCGFLYKLGYVRKNWLRRWFKLDLRKNCLAYFDKQEDAVPKGVIMCGKILEVYGDIEKRHKNKFYVRTAERTFEFKAPNKNLLTIWITILSMPRGIVNVR